MTPTILIKDINNIASCCRESFLLCKHEFITRDAVVSFLLQKNSSGKAQLSPITTKSYFTATLEPSTKRAIYIAKDKRVNFFHLRHAVECN